MDFDSLVSHLQIALEKPLPGPEAQALMAPRPRHQWPEGFNPARVRHAAGLLLLFPVGTTPYLVLTVRSDTLERHGGQVSLPGGVAEPGETFEQAALREAHEEVALAPAAVHVLGRLTPIDIPVSGFRLHPIVGVAAERPMLKPADGEVAGILEVPIADLFDPVCRVSLTRVRDGREVLAPAFHVVEAHVWGATAMVLAEFLTLLGWDPAASRG